MSANEEEADEEAEDKEIVIVSDEELGPKDEEAEDEELLGLLEQPQLPQGRRGSRISPLRTSEKTYLRFGTSRGPKNGPRRLGLCALGLVCVPSALFVCPRPCLCAIGLVCVPSALFAWPRPCLWALGLVYGTSASFVCPRGRIAPAPRRSSRCVSHPVPLCFPTTGGKI